MSELDEGKIPYQAPKGPGWIGVDLDGTLAYYNPGEIWDGSIGPPIPQMVERVKLWLSEGKQVKIFTARVANNSDLVSYEDFEIILDQFKRISEWCEQHIGVVLPITAVKDINMTEYWDDRAVTVEKNTGRFFKFDA